MAAPTFSFFKKPSEEFNFTVDFSALILDSGEVIDSIAVTAVKCSDDTDATVDIIENSAESGGVVTVRVKAGVDKERYEISIVVTTDSNPANVFEGDVVMVVKK